MPAVRTVARVLSALQDVPAVPAQKCAQRCAARRRQGELVAPRGRSQLVTRAKPICNVVDSVTWSRPTCKMNGAMLEAIGGEGRESLRVMKTIKVRWL